MLRFESDAAFLERLYKAHYDSIYKLVKRTLYRYTSSKNDISDVVQDVFVVAAKRIDVLREHPNPVGWLLKTAQYECKGYIRTHFDRKEDLFETLDLYADYEDDFAKQDLLVSLEQMLKPEEYALLKAYCIEKRPVEEISREMGISPNLLRVRMHRLKKYLAAFFTFFVIFIGIYNI